MIHDFIGGNIYNPRYSKDGEPCTGVGGYMDYRANPSKWSRCSVEDFYAYFSSIHQRRSVCLGKNSNNTNSYLSMLYTCFKYSVFYILKCFQYPTLF